MTDLVPAQTGAVRRELRHERRFRPFDEDVARSVVEMVAAGSPPSAIRDLPGYPGSRTVSIWRQTNPDFDAEMAAAADEAADELAAKSLVVAADVNRRADCRAVEVRALQWMAGKLSRKYAPRGSEGASFTVNNTQINVEGDANLSPADAYRALLDG